MQLGLYFLFGRVMYCLLSIIIFNVPTLLLTPFSSDRYFIFKIFFSPPLIVERVKLYHPKVRVMAVWRSKTRPDIGTSSRANFGFIRRRRRKQKGSNEDILAPGPTSMVVSWIAKTPGLTRVVIRRGF